MFYVFHDDRPIYEVSFQSQRAIRDSFQVHSALDTVDQCLKKDFYLGPLRFDDLLIYAYVTPVNLRLLFVAGQKRQHDKSFDRALKEFFAKTAQALATALLNPLYPLGTALTSPTFDEKVKSYMREHLKSLLPIIKK